MTADRKDGPAGTLDDSKLARTVVKFWIEYQGHKIELRPGTTIVGRSASCQIVLDDGLVSRRHAQIRVDQQTAVLEDFGSVNGVFVNNKRVSQECALAGDDVIRMGKQELVLRATTVTLMDPAIRFAAETLHGDTTLRQTGEMPPAGVGAVTVESFAVLTNVADKVLALGRGLEAERVLSHTLELLLVASRSGAVKDALADQAAVYAVRLLNATRKPRWADYVFELFMNLRRPLPAAAVDQLYSALRSVSGIDLTRLRNYVALLQALQHSFGPAERFVVQRIEGLERIATL